MIPRAIAQALVGDDGLIHKSPDFDDGWRAEAERIATAYGLPAGASALECLFVAPFAGRRVAVVSVSGRRFQFLVMPRSLYNVIPDPFAIVERFPPRWDAGGPLESLEWPDEPLPRRTLAQLDAILKHGDGPFLLGACQTLVDGGRIMLKRDQPDAKVCRELWGLIPDSTRRSTWLATFAYSTDLGFGLVVLPQVPEAGLRGYLTEDQARDYPESRYERELQVAVEHGDQRTVDRLLARRTGMETLRLALWIVLGAAVLSLGTRILMNL
jgi:hypothetical protein